MTDWTVDQNFTRRFVGEMATILGPILITEAPPEEDKLRNTDLVSLQMRNYRIACRIRRPVDWRGRRVIDEYGEQFTIRCSRPTGTQTELEKMTDGGWGDFLFYGWADEIGAKLQAWLVGNLDAFRSWYFAVEKRRRSPRSPIPNRDGSSEFMAYRITELPAGFVVARRAAETLKPALESCPHCGVHYFWNYAKHVCIEATAADEDVYYDDGDVAQEPLFTIARPPVWDH